MSTIDLWPCNNEGEDNCAWDANTMGNHDGTSYVNYNGTTYPVTTDADTFMTFPVTVDTDAGIMSVNLEQYILVDVAPTEDNPEGGQELQLFASFARTIDITPGEVIIEVPVTEVPAPAPLPESPITDTVEEVAQPAPLPDTLPATGMDDFSPMTVVLGIVIILAGIVLTYKTRSPKNN